MFSSGYSYRYVAIDCFSSGYRYFFAIVFFRAATAIDLFNKSIAKTTNHSNKHYSNNVAIVFVAMIFCFCYRFFSSGYRYTAYIWQLPAHVLCSRVSTHSVCVCVVTYFVSVLHIVSLLVTSSRSSSSSAAAERMLP